MKLRLFSTFFKKVQSGILPVLLFTSPILAQTKYKAEDWLNYNRTYEGDRYSPLKQITTANVGKLHLLHSVDLGKDVSSMQTGPVVINGVMYFTTDTVTYAIDAATGKLIWRRVRPVQNPVGYGANRGVAYWEGRLFRGASDAHVFALDAKDGEIIWDVPLDIAGPGVSIPMAPLAWNGMLFIGNAGGDNAGITGHMYALDVNDGHVIWIAIIADSLRKGQFLKFFLEANSAGSPYSIEFGAQINRIFLCILKCSRGILPIALRYCSVPSGSGY